MEPILASSLLNLGSNLIQKAFPLSGNPQNSVENFESDLSRIQKKQEVVLDLDLLKTDLIESQELKDFLARNNGNTISLDQLSDGSVRFLSSSGDFITFQPDIPICETASLYLHGSFAEGKNTNLERPNSVILIS